MRHARLESVSEEGLRRELANQIRRVQAKHPERCATGPAPNMVLVEFLGSHDFAWAQIHKIERYRGQKDAPDGPTVSADEYHEAVNRLTGCAAACCLPGAAPADPAAARPAGTPAPSGRPRSTVGREEAAGGRRESTPARPPAGGPHQGRETKRSAGAALRSGKGGGSRPRPLGGGEAGRAQHGVGQMKAAEKEKSRPSALVGTAAARRVPRATWPKW